MNENKVKVWIARDADGSLCAYPTTPFREDDMWFCDEPITQLDSSLFPSIKWEDDEPTEAYITLAEPQEQPKHEIDWEQRRYEVIRDNLVHCPIYDDLDDYKEYLRVAMERTEMFINELKKQSE